MPERMETTSLEVKHGQKTERKWMELSADGGNAIQAAWMTRWTKSESISLRIRPHPQEQLGWPMSASRF